MSAQAVRGSTADRLSVARELLTRAHEHGTGGRRGADRAPSTHAVLPVAAPIANLFPGKGLPRGASISLGAPLSTSLVYALLATASATESWTAAVGLPQLGAVAASEAGVELSRLALIPAPGDQLAGVLAALAEGTDLIAVAGFAKLRPQQRQALTARIRARGAVLLATDGLPGADLHIQTRPDTTVGAGGWTGAGDDGHGRLRQRRVRLQVTGHGLPHTGRATTVLLPGPRGELAAASSPRAASDVPRTLAGRRVS